MHGRDGPSADDDSMYLTLREGDLAYSFHHFDLRRPPSKTIRRQQWVSRPDSKIPTVSLQNSPWSESLTLPRTSLPKAEHGGPAQPKFTPGGGAEGRGTGARARRARPAAGGRRPGSRRGRDTSQPLDFRQIPASVLSTRNPKASESLEN